MSKNISLLFLKLTYKGIKYFIIENLLLIIIKKNNKKIR